MLAAPLLILTGCRLNEIMTLKWEHVDLTEKMLRLPDSKTGDLVAPTPAHVERWVNQFDAAVQLPILRKMDHFLRQT